MEVRWESDWTHWCVTATSAKFFSVAYTTRAYPATFQTPTLSHSGLSWQWWTTATRAAYTTCFSRADTIQTRRRVPADQRGCRPQFQVICRAQISSIDSNIAVSNFEKLRRVERRTDDSICSGRWTMAAINRWSEISSVSLTITHYHSLARSEQETTTWRSRSRASVEWRVKSTRTSWTSARYQRQQSKRLSVQSVIQL